MHLSLRSRRGHQAFDAEGGLKDANVEKAVRGTGAALAATVINIGTFDRVSVGP